MSSQRFAPLPIFRSPAQAKLLTHLYVTARDEPLSLSALSERTEIPLSTVQREIDRLEKAGLVTSERLGQTRRVYANNDSPYFVEMRSLLLKAFGPVPLLANLLQRIPRIAASYIYGSWARRYRGEAGSPPRDLDLLIVGDPNVNQVYAAARRAEEQLGLEVNPTFASVEDWQHPVGLLKRIKSGPLIELPLR